MGNWCMKHFSWWAHDVMMQAREFEKGGDV
jgi:hypothetical protein